MSSTVSQEPKKPDKQASDADVLTLLWSMADTTWRMFTPPTILVGAGIWLDLKLETKPWLTILGAVVGLACSIWLVKRQLGETH